MKDSYLAYLSDKFKDDSIGFVMLVDRNFKCVKKVKPGAYYGLQVKNQQRTLILRFKNSTRQNEWYDKITQLLSGPSKIFNQLINFVIPIINVFLSFKVNAFWVLYQIVPSHQFEPTRCVVGLSMLNLTWKMS